MILHILKLLFNSDNWLLQREKCFCSCSLLNWPKIILMVTEVLFWGWNLLPSLSKCNLVCDLPSPPYVCVYIYNYVYIYMWICKHVYIYTHLNAYVLLNIFICAYVCQYIQNMYYNVCVHACVYMISINCFILILSDYFESVKYFSHITIFSGLHFLLIFHLSNLRNLLPF